MRYRDVEISTACLDRRIKFKRNERNEKGERDGEGEILVQTCVFKRAV